MFCVSVGVSVTDRFRELERPQSGRLKDVVLMATVTGFEGLRHPRKSDLRQFAELFEPLFLSSSDEARRQAAAALSQCPHVPDRVSLIIGSAPISIAAIYLTRALAIDDNTLVTIVRSQGLAHGTAIARRENLSVNVVDALVERRQTYGTQPQAPRTAALPARERAVRAPQAPDHDTSLITAAERDEARARHLREENLRRELKTLALTTRQPSQQAAQPLLAPIDSLHEALLVRFARSGEANLFAASLSTALEASPLLAERILLDISGQQMATTLLALSLNRADLMFVLQALYPDLADRLGATTRAEVLIQNTDVVAARERVEAWLRADRDSDPDSNGVVHHRPHLAGDRPADARQPATRPVSPERATGEPDTAPRRQRSFGR